MIKRVSFFKIIVSTFILILLLNNFSTIVVYASTEDISEDENNIEMISENKNTEENNEEIIGVKEEVEKNITEEVIQKDEDIEKDDVEIISKDIPKDQEENKEIINKEEIENNNETKYKEEIPQCVQDFLNNVSKIPTNITTENAEQVAELLYGICSDTYEELLNTEYINREDVKKAIITYSKSIENVEELLSLKADNYYTEPLPNYTAHDIFYYNGQPECYLYMNIKPNNVKAKYKDKAAYISTKVNEKNVYQWMHTLSDSCTKCGNRLLEYLPEWVTVVQSREEYFINSNREVIKDINFSLEEYIAKDYTEYNGYPSIQIEFKGNKPGITELKFPTWQEYYWKYTYLRCKNCGSTKGSSFNGWVQNDETLNITVNADYRLIYDANVSEYEKNYITNIPENERKTVAETSTKFSISKKIPTREGHTFLGWTDIKDSIQVKYQAGEEITLNWEEGYGSTEKPVSKTLYAVWEKDEEYNYTEYKVVRKYYINGEKVAEVTGGWKVGIIGENISANELSEENPNWKFYTVDGTTIEFNYKNNPDNNIILVENTKENIITLRYEYNTYANYKVEWYDIYDNKLKSDEYRTGIIGNEVQVNDEDKIINGYIFDEKNTKNILKEILKDDGTTILKLYFIQEENVTEEPDIPILPKPGQEEIIEKNEKIENENKLNEENTNINKVENNKNNDIVDTGDNSQTKIYVILTIISLTGIITLLFIMQKSKIEKIFKNIIKVIILVVILGNIKNLNYKENNVQAELKNIKINDETIYFRR